MKLKIAVATGAAGLVFLGAGGALANQVGMPGGVVGTFAPTNHPVVAAKDGVALLAKPGTEVATLPKTYEKAGSFTVSPEGKVTLTDRAGWHDHPGIVIATMQSGEVTRWVDKGNDRKGKPICVKETFKAGDSFTEVEAHKVQNFGDIPAVLSLTTIHPDTTPTDDPWNPVANPFTRQLSAERIAALDAVCKA